LSDIGLKFESLTHQIQQHLCCLIEMQLPFWTKVA